MLTVAAKKSTAWKWIISQNQKDWQKMAYIASGVASHHTAYICESDSYHSGKSLPSGYVITLSMIAEVDRNIDPIHGQSWLNDTGAAHSSKRLEDLLWVAKLLHRSRFLEFLCFPSDRGGTSSATAQSATYLVPNKAS